MAVPGNPLRCLLVTLSATILLSAEGSNCIYVKTRSRSATPDAGRITEADDVKVATETLWSLLKSGSLILDPLAAARGRMRVISRPTEATPNAGRITEAEDVKVAIEPRMPLSLRMPHSEHGSLLTDTVSTTMDATAWYPSAAAAAQSADATEEPDRGANSTERYPSVDAAAAQSADATEEPARGANSTERYPSVDATAWYPSASAADHSADATEEPARGANSTERYPSVDANEEPVDSVGFSFIRPVSQVCPEDAEEDPEQLPPIRYTVTADGVKLHLEDGQFVYKPFNVTLNVTSYITLLIQGEQCDHSATFRCTTLAGVEYVTSYNVSRNCTTEEQTPTHSDCIPTNKAVSLGDTLARLISSCFILVTGPMLGFLSMH